MEDYLTNQYTESEEELDISSLDWIDVLFNESETADQFLEDLKIKLKEKEMEYIEEINRLRNLYGEKITSTQS